MPIILPIILPIVSVNIAPLPPHVIYARQFHSSISAAIATIESPPDVAPVFGCQCGNIGFFSPRGREATAPFQRAVAASIGKWAN
jgi:hypothetical protein